MRINRTILGVSSVAVAILCAIGSIAGKALSPATATPYSSSQQASLQLKSIRADTEEHLLRLYNTHTLERIEIVYKHGDQYIPAALSNLDYFLRDNRTGDVRHLDPRLYDILSDLTSSVGQPGTQIDIVCGYRTPTTNEALRARSSGVAKNSRHIQAEAIDLRIPGVNTLKLRRAALAMHRGGVGYYPHHDFIHVDVGRVRQWCYNCPANLIPG